MNIKLLLFISTFFLSACVKPNGATSSFLDIYEDLRNRSLNIVKSYSEPTNLFFKQYGEEKTISSATNVVKNMMKDPDSAKFQQVRLVDFNGGKVVCGQVNSKNSYGGYAGYTNFVASSSSATLFESGNTKYPEIDAASNTGITTACVTGEVRPLSVIKPTDHNCIEGNCINGKGTATYSNGDKYVGEWKDSKQNGQGTITSVKGDKYVGEWKDGLFSGKGTATHADGKEYVGEYKGGKANGQGTVTYPDGAKYVGEVKDDKPNGKGTVTSANGDKYVGELKDGKFSGQGTFTTANGDKYVGEWKDSKQNGQGTETSTDGKVESGLWKDGEFVQ
jgi:hypothetical protein